MLSEWVGGCSGIRSLSPKPSVAALRYTAISPGHGFACPYGDGASIIESVEAMKPHACTAITAERLDVPFYNSATTPILVRCDWHDLFPERHMVPKRLAVPLMIQQEMRVWHRAQVGDRTPSSSAEAG